MTLIEVFADDEGLKRHFRVVCRGSVLAVDFDSRTGTVGKEASQSKSGRSSARVNVVTSKRFFTFFEKV